MKIELIEIYIGYSLIYKEVEDFIGGNAIWCLEYIKVGRKRKIPNSTAEVNNSYLFRGFNIYGEYYCEEEVTINNDEMILPGIDNQRISGFYKFNDDYSRLTIDPKDKEINPFYEGVYKVEFDNINYKCLLISETTKIKLQLSNH